MAKIIRAFVIRLDRESGDFWIALHTDTLNHTHTQHKKERPHGGERPWERDTHTHGLERQEI